MTKYPSQAQLAGLDVQILLARDLGRKRLSARLPKRSARLDAKSLLLIPRCFQPVVVLHCTEPECIRGAICSLDQVRMPESDDLHRAGVVPPCRRRPRRGSGCEPGTRCDDPRTMA